LADKTTNYNLTKPKSNEYYDIEVFNGNADIIDTELKNLNDDKVDKEPGKGLAEVVDNLTTNDSGKVLSAKQGKVLKDDLDAHKLDLATTSKDGHMSKEDKTKLNGIAAGANNYVHPGSGTNPHGTTKSDVGLFNVDNVKQMPISGGTFTGIVKAQSNTSYTTEQFRNVILSTADASGNASNGTIWIKYKP